MRRIVGLLACACATGCGFLIGSHDETPSETTSIDGGSDAASTDGQPSADAGSSTCGHTFCEDFEAAGAPQSRWSGVDTAGSLAITYVAGGAYEVKVPATNISRNMLRQDIPAGGRKHLVLDWDMNLRVADPSASFHVVTITTDGGATLVVGQQGGAMRLLAQASATGQIADVGGSTVQVGQWAHYKVEVTFDAASGSAALHINGITMTNPNIPTASSLPATYTLRVGLDVLADSPTDTTVDFDNLVLDLQ